ncbi:CoA transferase [Carboxylicivirga taeanensis]|uniref:CoA transferase n=1 Tax=Carboxylicivirga taeanensis TaxID=1416875 RepID=UPI003F6DB188
MKIDQTIENHDDLLKVIDNLLDDIGLKRTDLKGKVTFEGLDPIRPTVLKVGAGGAAVGVANSIASALLYQEKTGKGQDIHVDLRKAWAIHSKWQDISFDCCTVNGHSYLLQMSKFGEHSNCHFLPTLDKRWIMVDANYPSQMMKMCLIFNSGYKFEQLAASSVKRTADEWEAMGNAAMVPITKVRTQQEFKESEQWQAHITTPLIHIEKVGDSAPESLPKGPQPLSGIRSLSMVHVVAAPHTQSLLAEAGADCLNLHPVDWFEQPTFLLNCFTGVRHSAIDPLNDRSKIYRLIKEADVFVENLRPGLADRQGWSAQQLSEIRPGIIQGSIKLNVSGPYSQMPGFDFNAAALTGLFTETGTPDQPAAPNAVNVICDLFAGRLLAAGIQAALLRRAREGGSYKVSVSLAQVCTWFMSLGLIPKVNLLDISSLGPEHQWKKPDTQSGITAYGDTTVMTGQVDMSLTQPRWNDPIVSVPGSSYPEWLR